MRLTSVIASSSPPAGGAPLGQVIAAPAAGILLTLALLVIGTCYRAGRMPLLDTVARPFTWLLRVPGWAALPAALATGALVLAGAGFYWDVAVHIDRGRDAGSGAGRTCGCRFRGRRTSSARRSRSPSRPRSAAR